MQTDRQYLLAELDRTLAWSKFRQESPYSAAKGKKAFCNIVGACRAGQADARSAQSRKKLQDLLEALVLAESDEDLRKKLYSFCADICCEDRALEPLAWRKDAEISFNEKELREFLSGVSAGESFSSLVNGFMDRNRMSPKDVYTNACLSRQDFSRITKPGRGVKRGTVYSVAIGLRLDWNDTLRLLRSAGYAFREGNIFDAIMQFCIVKKIYDVEIINYLLYDRGQKTLANNGRIDVNDNGIK